MTTKEQYRSKVRGCKVTVLGAARSGLAVARLLERHGADVLVSEMRALEDAADAAKQLTLWGLDAEWAGHTEQALSRQWLVISPGVSIDAPVVKRAQANGMEIFGELEVASWFIGIPMVAVTGSNGKTTTTTLIAEMLNASGIISVAAGNIGLPLAEVALKTDELQAVVVEVSSFQMETARTFHPHVALFLNLTPDHLNRHGSMDVYGELKARVFKHQNPDDWAIYNYGDRRVTMLVEDVEAKRLPFAVKPLPADGGFVQDGQMMLRFDCKCHPLIPVDAMRLRGEHNVLNALASSLATLAMGGRIDAICHTLKTFTGLPHRMEIVGRVHGVEWINDSKATNVDAVWYALSGFDQPVVLIAGGRDKDSDFSMLTDRVRTHVKALVLIGEAADKMESVFKGVLPVLRASSLEEAVDMARGIASEGETVLLSPACASFDMFENYEDRGDQFRSLVLGLEE